LIVIATLIGGYFVSDWTYQRANPQRIASFLYVETLPKSVHNMRCDSTAITDISIKCEFNFDPADLPQLLKGSSGPGLASSVGRTVYNYSEPSPKNDFPSSSSLSCSDHPTQV
jgi:hypothetical protein